MFLHSLNPRIGDPLTMIFTGQDSATSKHWLRGRVLLCSSLHMHKGSYWESRELFGGTSVCTVSGVRASMDSLQSRRYVSCYSYFYRCLLDINLLFHRVVISILSKVVYLRRVRVSVYSWDEVLQFLVRLFAVNIFIVKLLVTLWTLFENFFIGFAFS